MTATIPALESLHHQLHGIQAVADPQTPEWSTTLQGYSSLTLAHHRPCLPTSAAKCVRALGHWRSSQTAIPYKDAPPR